MMERAMRKDVGFGFASGWLCKLDHITSPFWASDSFLEIEKAWTLIFKVSASL